jgi:3-oxoadipate enol-lactonase
MISVFIGALVAVTSSTATVGGGAAGGAAFLQLVAIRTSAPEFAASHPEQIAATRAMFEATPPEGYVAACAAVRDMDQRESVRSITRPTLVIAGGRDVATPPDNARYLASAIAGAAYVELPASHLSNIEAAQQFSAAVDDFLF